jgi:hypothetical protein
MEKRGRLHPIIDREGIRRFDRTEVENVARERLRSGFRAGMIYVDGELAAEVFRYFRDGIGFAEIVIRTHAPPETIRLLWEDYKRPLGAPPASATPADDSDQFEKDMRALDDEILARRRERRRGE